MNVLKRDLIEGEQIIVIDGSVWVFTEAWRSKSRRTAAGTVQGTGYKVGKRGREIGDLYSIFQSTAADGSIETPWKTDGKIFRPIR